MAISRLHPGPVERAALTEGARALGIEIERDALAGFVAFAGLLGLWSERTSLISCASAADLVERHLLDSLILLPHLRGVRRVVDLGSGAGFPGVPLAIARPDLALLLVESRRRRASFLRAVRRTLGLTNVEILEGRVEAGPVPGRPPADAAVSRAVWSDESILTLAVPWVRPGGILLWMRGGSGEPGGGRGHGSASPRSAAGRCRVAVPADAALAAERIVRYRIGSGPERSIRIFRRRAEGDSGPSDVSRGT